MDILPCAITITHPAHEWASYDIDSGTHQRVQCPGDSLTTESDDVFIGADRSQPFHFEGHRGQRMECPFCDWYLDQKWSLPDIREIDFEINTIRVEWTRVDLIAEKHLRDAHADEPEVQRALRSLNRDRKEEPDVP